MWYNSIYGDIFSGGVKMICSSKILNCEFDGNTAKNYGGTLYITSGKMQLM